MVLGMTNNILMSWSLTGCSENLLHCCHFTYSSVATGSAALAAEQQKHIANVMSMCGSVGNTWHNWLLAWPQDTIFVSMLEAIVSLYGRLSLTLIWANGRTLCPIVCPSKTPANLLPLWVKISVPGQGAFSVMNLSAAGKVPTENAIHLAGGSMIAINKSMDPMLDLLP